LSISSSTGAILTIDKPCQADCSTCEPIGCPAICAAPTAMKAEGEQRAWTGTYYASSTCGSGMSCAALACAPPGHYTAKMCAYAATGDRTAPFCNAGQIPTCATVEFDWPPIGGSATVTGVIDATTDGGKMDSSDGSCCPAGWLLYGCTYPDGATGQACHNPAMGCASSTTCGEGCDRVVDGRCEGQ
jgi:hypothetical protein